MAKKHQPSGKNLYGNTWFVRCRISGDQKDKFHGWQDGLGNEIYGLLEQVCFTGHKLALAWDDSKSSFIASFTCIDEKSANWGGIVTSWSQVALEAIALSLFKIDILLAGEDWPHSDEDVSWG